jgi:hypothetical protein
MQAPPVGTTTTTTTTTPPTGMQAPPVGTTTTTTTTPPPDGTTTTPPPPDTTTTTTTPPPDGTTPPDDGTTPPDDGTTPPDDGTTPPGTDDDIPPPMGWTQLEVLPTARTLREGDVYAHYVGYTGLFGLQYGVNGDVDVGGGLSFFTLELMTKYAFYHNDYMSIAAMAELIFPFYRKYWPMSAMGPLGLDYLMLLGLGPLFSLWNDKAELDVGLMFVPVMQWHNSRCNMSGTPAAETCDGGSYDADFLVMPWVAGSIRLGDFASLLLGFVHLALLGLDDWSCSAPVDAQGRCTATEGWQHTRDDRNYPTAMLGVRFNVDRFAIDFGLHFPLHPDWWNYIDWLVAIPWLSVGHLW